MSRQVAEALLEKFRTLFTDSDVVVVSDYMKGVVVPRLVAGLGAMNRDRSRLVGVDSKDLSRHRFHNVSVISPKHLEAQKAAKLPLPISLDGDRPDALEAAGRSLPDQIRTKWVIVTRGGGGALLFERDRPMVRIPARDVRTPDAVGAVDSLTAALALSLAAGLGIEDATRVAVDAAGIAVSEALTATLEQHELLQRLSNRDALTRFEDIAGCIEDFRRRGKAIVLANGEFDGLHSGHIAFLRAERRLGDVLIVGVNSDRSMHRRKGRAPLLPQEERLSVVAALEPVDHAMLFDEETPADLIRRVRPDIHVKGGAYEGQFLPERAVIEEVGARLVILPLQEPAVGPFGRRTDQRSPRRRPQLAMVRGGLDNGAYDWLPYIEELPEEAAS